MVLPGTNLAREKTYAKETAVKEIVLTGPVSKSKAEVSGMAWYKDYLIILPQYPHRFKTKKSGSKVFAISKKEIISYIDGNARVLPIEPRKVEFKARGLHKDILGFEGYESIAFWGDRVFLTVEASPFPGFMVGYLVRGTITEDASRITLDKKPGPAKINPQAAIRNFSDETLLVTKDRVITIYEGNGKNINPKPVAHVFNHNLELLERIPFPSIEYRITDAAAPDSRGRFWCLNYLYPGNVKKLYPAADPIARKYGVGPTQSGSGTVERLVQFQLTTKEILLVPKAPVYFQLIDKPRNWEGIVRLDNRGFLIITDQHPRTILGFVAW
jgi:hypothetical protein